MNHEANRLEYLQNNLRNDKLLWNYHQWIWRIPCSGKDWVRIQRIQVTSLTYLSSHPLSNRNVDKILENLECFYQNIHQCVNNISRRTTTLSMTWASDLKVSPSRTPRDVKVEKKLLAFFSAFERSSEIPVAVSLFMNAWIVELKPSLIVVTGLKSVDLEALST